MEGRGSAGPEVWGGTDVGMKRRLNEDVYLIDRDAGLYLVADGMGGHAAGEVASRLAAEEILRVFRSSEDIEAGTWPPDWNSEWSVVANRLRDAILAGRADYDLLLGPAALLAPLQQAGKIQAMDDLFPPSFLDGFASVTLTGVRRQGRVWGLPDTAGFHLLLFYNRERVESPPTATDELMKMAAPLTGGELWGLTLNSYDPLWVLPWLAGYGGWLADDAGNPTLNSAAMVQALTLYRNWHRSPGGIAPLVSHVQAEALFRSGQAAMLIDGEWALEWLPVEADFDWGAAPLPAVGETGRPTAPLVVGRYWAVGSEASGRRVEGAIAFLEFVTRPERQLAWTAQFGLLPTRRDALNAPPILTDPLLRASAGQLQAGRGVPLGVDVDALLNAMRLPLRQLLNGDLSPEEAARQMQANVP